MSAKKVLHYVKEIAQTIPKKLFGVWGRHLFAVMKGLLLSTILLAIILNHALGGILYNSAELCLLTCIYRTSTEMYRKVYGSVVSKIQSTKHGKN